MAKTAKRAKGDIGEDVCCKYLQSKGYTVIDRNYLRKWGEIDIVAKKGQKISFVEVKTVSREISKQFHPEHLSKGGVFRPEDNMHPGKIKRIHRAIQTYLLDHKVPDETEWQLDLACVYLDFSTHKARVLLMENIIL